MIQENVGSEAVVAEIARLRQWEGEPREFWSRLAAVLAAVAGSTRVLIAIKAAGEGRDWKRIADHGQYAGPAPVLERFMGRLEELAESGGGNGEPVLTPLGEGRAGADGPVALAVRFELREATACVGLLLLVGLGGGAVREVARRVNLLRDIPRSYEAFREAIRARTEARKLAVVLDLVAAMDSEPRFLAAGLAWVNALADRFQCDRVSLGWLERGQVRLRVMSRTEHFDRQMGAAAALETVMEESLDQDEDVVHPPPAGARWVSRDHERYAAEQRAGHVASFPLRLAGRVEAVVTCERASRPFELTELQQVRLGVDLAARRLAELKRWDRWFGARWAGAVREGAARLVGPEQTWMKLAAGLTAGLLAVLFLVPVPYRVEGKFQLRSDAVLHVTAPFESYLREVRVRPGDWVAAGEELLRLDTEELELEEVAALADLTRHLREAERARAASALAEMRVAEAQARQAEARLELVRHRLRQAALRTPFDSVVVEGDLRERIGAPVKAGDTLVRVARLDQLYIEAQVDERDIHELVPGAEGEIAFVSQPRRKYPVRIERIEPAAVPRQAENVFLVRCGLEVPADAWWRPGMTGVCKLNVGRRSLAWILSRRTVDFLRMRLWW